MTISKRIIAGLLLFFCWFSGNAQTSGLDFLNLGPNTIALSLGETVTAHSIGASDIYTNPANLAMAETSSLSADFALWIADLQNSHLAVNFKRNNSAIAFGVLSSSSDDFEARTQPGPPDGTFSVTYLSLAGAYAFNIKNFSVGGAGQFLREEFFTNNASGYAFNFGLASHWFDRRLRIGTSLLNLGEMEELITEATKLPTVFRAGIAFDAGAFMLPRNPDLPIKVSVYSDFIDPIEEEIKSDFISHNPTEPFFNFGAGFLVAETIEVRAGYKTGNTERPISLGIGILLESLSFNYAAIPFKTGFGTVHSVGLQYDF